ncbi:hypothetical protein ACFV4I_25250 [Nocardiopsis alba]
MRPRIRERTDEDLDELGTILPRVHAFDGSPGVPAHCYAWSPSAT